MSSPPSVATPWVAAGGSLSTGGLLRYWPVFVGVALIGVIVGALMMQGSDRSESSVAIRNASAQNDSATGGGREATASSGDDFDPGPEEDAFVPDSGSGAGEGSSSPPGSSTGSSEAADSVPVGRWILVLESMPKSANTLGSTIRQADSIGGNGIVVLDSDRTPGLNGGYWVIAGASFDSREAAVATCSSFGRAVGGSCYPTRVGDGAR